MAFMRPEVYKGEYYEVETSNGTEFIPVDVSGYVDSWDQLAEYCEGEIYDEDDGPEVKTGWIGRMSAPGYMDCTDWTVGETKEAIMEELEDMYGPFDDEDDE